MDRGVKKSFLGDNQLMKLVSGSLIALTTYGENAGFEEWHAHENDSISLLLSGSHREDLLGKQLKRTPGNIKFIPAGVRHRCYVYAPGTRKINLELNRTLVRQMGTDGGELMAANSLPAKFTLLKLYHELDDNGSHSTASAELLLYELFNPVHPPKLKTSGAAPQWTERLRELLNDEWNQPICLEDLSARLGIHPVTISRYFPLYFSATLGSYLRQLKIDKAITLIKGSSTSLTDIAYTCGFADQAHFTRTFKTVTGYLPKEFRKA